MMPAGVYYVGDLCYVMTDEEWDQFCGVTIQGNRCLDGEFNLPDGRRFATYGTMWGDGDYRDQHGNRYGVDSGSIGCILLSDIRANKYEDIKELGTVVEFTEDILTSGCIKGRDSNGVISIGPLRIDTDPSDYTMDDDDQ